MIFYLLWFNGSFLELKFLQETYLFFVFVAVQGSVSDRMVLATHSLEHLALDTIAQVSG